MKNPVWGTERQGDKLKPPDLQKHVMDVAPKPSQVAELPLPTGGFRPRDPPLQIPSGRSRNRIWYFPGAMSGEHFGISRDGDECGDFRLCPRWSIRDGARDPIARKFEECPFERGVSGDLAGGGIQKMNHGGVEAKAL